MAPRRPVTRTARRRRIRGPASQETGRPVPTAVSSPTTGSAGPDDGPAGPDNSAFLAPDDPTSDPGTNGSGESTKQPEGGRGADQAGPGQDNAGGPASPEEISRRLAGDDSTFGSGTGRTRRNTRGLGLGEEDLSAFTGDAADGTTTTLAPDPFPDPAAVSELPADFDESATPPPPAAADETHLDAAALLSQAGHTKPPPNKPALWATAIAFGALLLVSAAWLWTRRGHLRPRLIGSPDRQSVARADETGHGLPRPGPLVSSCGAARARAR